MPAYLIDFVMCRVWELRYRAKPGGPDRLRLLPAHHVLFHGASVFSLAGIPANNPIGSYLTVGQWSANGSTQSLTGQFDRNANGLPLTNETFSGTYSAAANGRTLITVSNPQFHYVAYPVSSTRFVGLSIEPNDYAALVASLDQ
jgi:hypothetical protein